MDILFIISIIFLALAALLFIKSIVDRLSQDKEKVNSRKLSAIFFVIYVITFVIWILIKNS